jgi:hypothetical protein
MGQALVGIDFRPATGQCYGLGYNATTGEAQLYTIALNTGMATAVGAAPFQLDLGNGANVGFDFNPTVDRIRVVAANNTNYRLNPITGALAATDANLNFAAGDVNQGMDPFIGAAAYTNSFNTATTTVLYGFDEMLGLLVTQVPPNNGTLNTVGLAGIILNPTDASSDIDIYYDFETASNLAFCSANPGTTTADVFYTIDLATGLLVFTGKIGLGIAVRDIAIFPDSIVTVGIQEVVAANANRLAVFPNPVQSHANISFDLAASAQVRLVVTDIAGRQIAVLADQNFGAGSQSINWTPTQVLPGYYMIQLFVDNALQGVSKIIIP